MMKNSFTVAVVFLSLLLQSTAADEIRIAVASNFSTPMKALIQSFARQSSHTVVAAYGSSGKLYTQIYHGAPFHAFFSADQSKPEALIDAALATPASQFTYALGSLVLWSADSHTTVNRERLQQRDFNKLALANPKLAPYGVAAVETLQHLNLMDATRDKWVLGENIAQTWQFVSSGNAELGLVAWSQVVSSELGKRGSYWRIPGAYHNPIRQDAILLKRAAEHTATQEFLRYMRGTTARSIIRSHGYLLPDT